MDFLRGKLRQRSSQGRDTGPISPGTFVLERREGNRFGVSVSPYPTKTPESHRRSATKESSEGSRSFWRNYWIGRRGSSATSSQSTNDPSSYDSSCPGSPDLSLSSRSRFFSPQPQKRYSHRDQLAEHDIANRNLGHEFNNFSANNGRAECERLFQTNYVHGPACQLDNDMTDSNGYHSVSQSLRNQDGDQAREENGGKLDDFGGKTIAESSDDIALSDTESGYNMPDYKSLFERERREKQECSMRLEELESKQRLLEHSLSKFLDLRRELRELNTQAEEADQLIDSIIQDAVPEFVPKRNAVDQDATYNEVRNRLRLFRGGRMDFSKFHAQQKEEDPDNLFRANPAFADPELPRSPTPPPLPSVSYSWDTASTTPSPLHSYGRYSFTSKLPTKLDELKLDLKYDVTSSLLPTKLQLEIRDKQGKIVYRKRQNLYYVKVQERLSTLDGGDDYIMTVTSITGNRRACEDVPIRNKNYEAERLKSESERSVITPGYEVTESITLPSGLQTCRSPSESSLTSGFDEKSIDSIFDGPIRNIESNYEEMRREMSETPVPDLEEIVEMESMEEIQKVKEKTPPMIDETPETPEPEEPKRNPFTLIKKPIVPEIKYRWQYGFRRGAGGLYQKVPILKVEFKYRDAAPLLPASLVVSAANGQERTTVPVAQGAGLLEIVLSADSPSELTVTAKDKFGEAHLTSPQFSLRPLTCDTSELGRWYSEAPVLQIGF